jgi:transposase
VSLSHSQPTDRPRNDVTQLIPLVDAVPPIRGRRGCPPPAARESFADHGYDHEIYRRQLRPRGITPRIARRGVAHCSGLGKQRWVVERAFAGLHASKRLRTRYEHRADVNMGYFSWPAAPDGVSYPGLEAVLRDVPYDDPDEVVNDWTKEGRLVANGEHRLHSRRYTLGTATAEH